MAGGIMTLDLATKTGWACSRESGVPAYGVRRIGRPQCSDGEFFCDFFGWLSDMIVVEAPRAMIFEAPILTAGKTSVQTARRLMGLAVFAEMLGTKNGIPRVFEANNSTVRKFFTGNGRAQKEDVVRECQRRGWAPQDDNAADALAILAYAQHCFGPAKPDAGALFRAVGS